MARGFCTCKRDFPRHSHLHPPANATWHYLCDKPVLGPALGLAETGTGWPDEDAESERIAEVFDDARAELDRGL